MAHKEVESNKEKLKKATEIFREKIEEVKQLEQQAGKPLSSSDILKEFGEVEMGIAEEKSKKIVAALSSKLDEALTIYNDPINTHTKQLKILRQAYEQLARIFNIGINSLKATAWIIGAIVALFTLIQIMKEIFIK